MLKNKKFNQIVKKFYHHNFTHGVLHYALNVSLYVTESVWEAYVNDRRCTNDSQVEVDSGTCCGDVYDITVLPKEIKYNIN